MDGAPPPSYPARVGGTAFIIGGTGQLGHAAALALAGAGWRVTVASRRGGLPADLASCGVTAAALDRDRSGALAGTLGNGADLLLDLVGYHGDHSRQLVAVQGSVGRIVAVSSASVYSDARGRTLDEAAVGGFPHFPGAIAEDRPTVDPGPATYSTRKVEMERVLLDGARVPAAVLRPCAIHGWPTVHPREWWFVKRLLDGRQRIPLRRCGADRFQTTAAANLAALVGRLAGQRFTGVLNVADADAPAVAEIGRTVMDVVGRSADLVPAPDDAPPHVGSTPWSVPHPIILDGRAARALGHDPPTYAASVAPTLRRMAQPAGRGWEERFPLLAAYPWPMFDYAAEDARPDA